MTTYRHLSKSDIERWVGHAAFEEGVAYAAQDTMANVSYSGMTVQAECLGPRPHIYQMEVVLDEEGIFQSRCSCPAGGTCKHVAALLLTCLDDPDLFGGASQPTSDLLQRSKEELIALIDQMVGHAPELASLFDLPPNTYDSTQPIQPEKIRQQISLIMSNYDGVNINTYSWVAKQLAPLLSMGNEYAKAGDWPNAATVYEIITRGVLDEKRYFIDDENELGRTIMHCIMGLSKCLNATQESTQREKIQRALFDIYRWEVINGIEIRPKPSTLLLTHCTTAEKERVSAWIRAAIENTKGWRRYHLGGFLLKLSEPLSDESYLRICRQSGRCHDLVNRLLDLGRVAEAEAETGATCYPTAIK